MHNIHIGPTTAAIERPITRPRTKRLTSIFSSLVLAHKKLARPLRGLASYRMPASRCLRTSKANQTSNQVGLLVLSPYIQEAREHHYWNLRKFAAFSKTDTTAISNVARKPRQNEMT